MRSGCLKSSRRHGIGAPLTCEPVRPRPFAKKPRPAEKSGVTIMLDGEKRPIFILGSAGQISYPQRFADGRQIFWLRIVIDRRVRAYMHAVWRENTTHASKHAPCVKFPNRDLMVLVEYHDAICNGLSIPLRRMNHKPIPKGRMNWVRL